MRATRAAAMVFASLLALAAVPARAADDATAQARSHYEMGLKLFDSMLWLNRAEKVGSSISSHSDHPSVLG